MITPRVTRLVRVADLRAFRAALAALCADGTPLDSRDRLVVVPTRAAGEHLQRTLEAGLLARAPEGAVSSGTAQPGPHAMLLPDIVPVGELVAALAQRLDDPPIVLSEAEREVLLGVSCRHVRDTGIEPPFRLRPGLVSEMLRFYDTLRRNQKGLDDFERLALGLLEPGALDDRGAERLVRQTKFLVAAFRDFEARCAPVGVDAHGLRDLLLARPCRAPYRHVVLTVADRAQDVHGLRPAEWDLLSRVPGLERLDIVATDRIVAGPFHEAIHQVLPGIEEVRVGDDEPAPTPPSLSVPSTDALVFRLRDREDEVADFARRVKHAVRTGRLDGPSRAALVVHHRLPYVYLARDVCRSAGLPCQMFDALPLAAEPFSAALDLVLSAVASNFARSPSVALLRSPHLSFVSSVGGEGVSQRDIEALDRALAESSYLGDPSALRRATAPWRERAETDARLARLVRVADRLLEVADQLAPLQEPRPVAEHLRTLSTFLTGYEGPLPVDEAVRARHLRARGAVLGTLSSLASAFQRFDAAPIGFADVRALVRRWIDAQTFAPRSGEAGVHLVDSVSARFGDFDLVQLAGLVDGEWPEPPRRDIFYSPFVLRDLGWTSERDRIGGARAAFADLLTLPSRRLVVSNFLLESDALVTGSPFIDELAAAGLDAVEDPSPRHRIFEHEALAIGMPRPEVLGSEARHWLTLRLEAQTGHGAEYRGWAGPHEPTALSLSAIERYVDCPFKFFAADVLRLEEPPEDDAALSPRSRGRLVHEALQRFFDAWDRQGLGPIQPDNIVQARAVFAEAVAPLLDRLSATDAALERARLFGTAISPGIVETVLSHEATRRPDRVVRRLLEHRLEGDFTLGDPDCRVPLRGVADRIDVLPGRRVRVVDYKSGSAPPAKLALQAPIYALCATERLGAADGGVWTVDEASYLGLSGARTYVPVVRPGASDGESRLADARGRVLDVVDGVRAGVFPPRPLDEMSCRKCAYASVCRKDYVGDE